MIKQVCSDNDASELNILGQFGGHFDEFGTLGKLTTKSFKFPKKDALLSKRSC